MSAEKELIPKLDLESFVFTPPGPMGWAFEITEEEEAHVKQGIQNIIAAEETLSLDSLVELSSHRQIVPTNATVEKVAEVVRYEEKQEVSKEIDKETIDEAVKKQKEEETKHELAKVEHEEIEETEEGNNDGIVEVEVEVEVEIENKVTIILPNGPLKAPLLLSKQLKKFKK